MKTYRLFIIATLFCGLISISLLPASAGENWTSYRGSTDQGHSDSTDLPLTWSESENIAWKTEIKGKAWSSPVIWGDKIWLTNTPEGGSKLSAICVDKNSGKIIHDKKLRVVAAPQYCHPFNSYGSPSPVIEDGLVYVTFGAPFTGCLDSKTGDVIWERTDFVCNHFRGPGSSPMIYGDLLILNFDGSDEQYLVAMDKKTGKTVWKTERSIDFQDIDPKTGKPEREGDWRKAYSTPIIVKDGDRDVLISLGSMALYAYDPKTGEELWRVEKLKSHSGACRPVSGHGLVFAPLGAGGELIAVKPDGKGVVTDSHVVWRYKRVVSKRPSPLLIGDLIFMVDDGGIAVCVEAKTGKEVWKTRLGGNYSASPVYADGKIYFFDEDGKSTVIEPGREYKKIAGNELEGGCMASPAISGKALFVRTKTHLYRIEK